jgi:hypothetical protein
MPPLYYLLVSMINSLLGVFVGWLLNSRSHAHKSNQEDIKTNIKKAFLLSHKLSRIPRVLISIAWHYKGSKPEEGIYIEKKYIKTILYEHIDSLLEIFTLKFKNNDLFFKLKRLELYIESAYELTKNGQVIKPEKISLEKKNKENFYKHILDEIGADKSGFVHYNNALRFFIEDLMDDIEAFLNSLNIEKKPSWKKLLERKNL